ncbi:hypothetical protein CAL7716_085500 [Calothrix sp. PCC 7716]|nr:hypothetical protein CAL7716_085500 [Calothrix sp. PCC 7716]
MYTIFKDNGEFCATDDNQNVYEMDFQDDLDEGIFQRLNEGYGEIAKSKFSYSSSIFTNASLFPELQSRGLVALHRKRNV